MKKAAFKKTTAGKYATDFLDKKTLVKISNRRVRRAAKAELKKVY